MGQRCDREELSPIGCNCGSPRGYDRVYQFLKTGQSVQEFSTEEQAKAAKNQTGGGRIQMVLRRK